MLMGVGALYKAGLVEWMSTMTYQAASGGGAQHMRELLTQYGTLNAAVRALLDDPKSAILEIDRRVVARQRGLSAEETANFGVPLGGSLIPWIDKDLGRRRLARRVEGHGRDQQDPRPGRHRAIPVDGLCVRVGAMRCHSQALTFKLKKDVPVADIEAMIAADNAWAQVVPNTREATLQQLTPVAVTGTMTIPVGRIRKLAMGPQLPRRLHDRRPAAVGRGRTAAPHAAPAGEPVAVAQASLPRRQHAHRIRGNKPFPPRSSGFR